MAQPDIRAFDHHRWQDACSTQLERPWQGLLDHVHRSSQRLPWSGLSVWHQRGPAGDLYVPPASSHCILLRRAIDADLLQRHGDSVRQTPWTPGTVVVVPAGLPSFWRSNAIRDNIHVGLDPAWLQRVTDSPVVLGNSFGRADPVLAGFAYTLLAALDSNTALRPGFAEHLASGLALHLIDNYAVQTPSASRAGLSQRQMALITDAVLAALDDAWPVTRLAALVDLSPFHFSRAFKASAGLSPHRYVSDLRLRMAAQWLRTTRRPLADIALAVGHASPSHFAQAFRRQWGVTPQAYRRLHGPAAPAVYP